MNKTKYIICAFLLAALSSCYKEQDISDDPYVGGKEPLGVLFSAEDPDIGVVRPGDIVVLKVKGVSSYISKGLEFFINNEKSEIVEVTDSTLSVKVPELVSSGGTSIHVQNQVFFGPRLQIDGNISIDKNFNYLKGSNGPIYDFSPFQGGYLLVGSFSDYAGATTTTNFVSNLAYIDTKGEYQLNNSFGRGTNGVITNVQRLEDGKYLIAGSFSTFNRRTGINNITRLNNNGSLDSTIIDIINITPLEFPKRSFDTVATFNGGVSGSLRKVFANSDPIKGQMLTAIGSFQHYGKFFYERSTWDMKVLDATMVNQVVRMNSNGSIDSTYNFDPITRKAYAGGNGNVNDGYMQEDGKLILVGDFTTYHQQSANRIVRLNIDGSVDQNFNTSGANGTIYSIQRINRTGKYLVVGNFSTFNGEPVNQVVRLNSDGSLDETLKVKTFGAGYPNHAFEIQDGRIIVSGTFQQYDGVTRRGFLVLENDGTARQVNNNLGAYAGRIYRVMETTSTFGNPAVILMGYVSKFDDITVKNIVKVELKNQN
jgi:uncharacterized delta-60 repeat protein